MTTYRVVHQSLPRLGALERATGATHYATDFNPPGLLIGKVLRSPHPHARILSIDVRRATALPGVRAVLTARDVPENNTGRWVMDRPILARGKVRHVGEPVVAVAAEDEETAEEALELVRVEYEPLPAVFDPLAALAPGAPLVHEDIGAYTHSEPEPKHRGNALQNFHYRTGDVEAGFAEADLVYEQTYRLTAVHQGHMEPHQVIAATGVSGKVTLWDSTKAPFPVRRYLADAINLPVSHLRVIAPAVGGDFGGKGTLNIEPICALLSLASGRPVRLALKWDEELASAFVRTSAVITVRIGVKSSGALVALKGQAVYDNGAYCDNGGELANSAVCLQGPYRIPNVNLEVSTVYTNKTPTGHCRGPFGAQAHFAIESHIDEVAQRLNLDPVQLRLNNAMENGDRLCNGGILRNAGLKDTLEALGRFLEAQPPLRPHQGWGMACNQWSLHPISGEGPNSSAVVKLNEDGTATLLTGCPETGGGQHGILAQIVAEALAIPYDWVTVVAADTDATPWDRGTGASLTTYQVGTAVRLAAEDARDQLLSLAAQRLRLDKNALVLGEREIYVQDAPEVSVSRAALAAAALTSRGGPILGTGRLLREQWMETYDATKGTTDRLCHGAHAALVEVDPDTGQTRVLRHFASFDAGFAINPQNVEGQVHGGVSQGLGYALYEGILTSNGRILNATLLDYRLPTAADVPPVQVGLVEVPSQAGPYGAKGPGEGTSLGVAPAIANAISRATGRRFTELPITPERVCLALLEGNRLSRRG